jgi:TonB family protein
MSDTRHDFGLKLTWVTVAHGVVIGALLGLSLVHGCGRAEFPNGPVELFVDIPADLAGPAGGKEDLSEEVAPAPPPKAPIPAAKPPPEDDFPAVKNPEDRKKPDAKKAEAGKPGAASANTIKVSRKLVPLPATTTRKSKLSAAEIQKLLDRGAKPGKSSLSDADLRRLLNTDARFGNGSPISQEFVVIEQIRQALYRAWAQPTQLGVAGLVTRVEITFTPDGGVVGGRLLGGSGNAVMDASVLKAVQSVRRIPGLPSSFLASHRRIPVAFELTGHD